MNVRWIAAGFGAVGLWLTTAGCGAVGAVSGAASSATQTSSDIKGTKDQAKGLSDDAQAQVGEGKDALDKAKGGGKVRSKDGDPDGDGTRIAAAKAKPNEPITDEVDPKKKDVNDWRYFELGGARSGPVLVQLNWDDATADLNVDLYDQMGANIAASPAKGPSPVKRVVAQVDPGRVYVRVSSTKGGTVYTMKLKWDGGAGGQAAAPADGGDDRPARPHGSHAASGGSSGSSGGSGSGASGSAPGQVPPPSVPQGGGGGPPAGGAMAGGAAAGGGGAASGAAAGGSAGGAAAVAAEDPEHPRAKIVQSYRDGSVLVLYLDKGSAVNIHAGMTGTILEGETDKPLDGGAIRVTKVIDATKSIAQCNVSKVGKNNKVMINLIK